MKPYNSTLRVTGKSEAIYCPEDNKKGRSASKKRIVRRSKKAARQEAYKNINKSSHDI